jgi:hypothetical protein
MNLDVALSALLVFSAACYLMMGSRLVAAKREVGSMPIGVLFVVISIWVAGVFYRSHRAFHWHRIGSDRSLCLLSRVHGLGNAGAYAFVVERYSPRVGAAGCDEQ